MGYKSKYTGQQVENLLDKVNQGDGGGGGVISTTYQELKDMRDNGELQPFQWYRITDFVTTCGGYGYGDYEANESEIISAGNQFDVVVLATSESAIAEDAYAALHDGDEYFTNYGSNLGAWKLKYSLDAGKFDWVDIVCYEESFRGVIYFMRDEFGNTANFDFKNIKFKREEEYFGLNGYFYTFTLGDDEDASLSGSITNIIIKEYTYEQFVALPNIVLLAYALFNITINTKHRTTAFIINTSGKPVSLLIESTIPSFEAYLQYQNNIVAEEGVVNGYNDIDLFELIQK
jgi:hypothetical protein